MRTKLEKNKHSSRKQIMQVWQCKGMHWHCKMRKSTEMETAKSMAVHQLGPIWTTLRMNQSCSFTGVKDMKENNDTPYALWLIQHNAMDNHHFQQIKHHKTSYQWAISHSYAEQRVYRCNTSPARSIRMPSPATRFRPFGPLTSGVRHPIRDATERLVS